MNVGTYEVSYRIANDETVFEPPTMTVYSDLIMTEEVATYELDTFIAVEVTLEEGQVIRLCKLSNVETIEMEIVLKPIE